MNHGQCHITDRLLREYILQRCILLEKRPAAVDEALPLWSWLRWNCTANLNLELRYCS